MKGEKFLRCWERVWTAECFFVKVCHQFLLTALQNCHLLSRMKHLIWFPYPQKNCDHENMERKLVPIHLHDKLLKPPVIFLDEDMTIVKSETICIHHFPLKTCWHLSAMAIIMDSVYNSYKFNQLSSCWSNAVMNLGVLYTTQPQNLKNWGWEERESQEIQRFRESLNQTSSFFLSYHKKERNQRVEEWKIEGESQGIRVKFLDVRRNLLPLKLVAFGKIW